MTYGKIWIYDIIGRSRKIYYIAYLQLESVELVGHRKESIESLNKIGKEKLSAEAKSSKENH
jgi:hypothetical protein